MESSKHPHIAISLRMRRTFFIISRKLLTFTDLVLGYKDGPWGHRSTPYFNHIFAHAQIDPTILEFQQQCKGGHCREEAQFLQKALLAYCFGWLAVTICIDRTSIAPSDFHLFLKLKEFLGGKRFGSDEELENEVNTWLNKLAAEEYHM
ncbi:hypothetical protein AVEN_35827-1 [Araneus ventricosus]|uniref:Uncharacterized protein n=1 Tax=Araneus ventricosus TaxID=182803 RepID=A0A4Y2BM62_ARAVE|nr:hypothetical protein AVEN_35827-1 [Araneus ventricosus]